MAQRIPLPLTSLASVKFRLDLPFWYRHTQVVPENGVAHPDTHGKRAVKRLSVCVCVCMCVVPYADLHMAQRIPLPLISVCGVCVVCVVCGGGVCVCCGVCVWCSVVVCVVCVCVVCVCGVCVLVRPHHWGLF